MIVGMGMREGLRLCPRRLLLALGGASCLLAAGPTTGLAATQTLQVQAAPGAQATRPEAITATGAVGVPSTITTYAQFGATPCAAQAAAEATRGATLVDQRTVNGSFSFTASFTPAAAGTYFICTYLDGASAGMTEHQNQAFVISVAPAPAPPPGPTPPPVVTPRPGSTCLVANLKRHTLRGAQHLLAIGNCKLGRVYRPSARALRTAKRRNGGRAPTLVVVSQTPAAGSVRIAGYTVAVRLAFGPAPPTRSSKPTP